jgi:crotonobetaine/carnitine-CoA ligase
MNSPQLFCEQIRLRAAETPNKAFLLDGRRTVTYAQVWETINRLACRFLDRGLARNDRCIVFMANGIDYALVWLALARFGATSVLINQAYKGPLLAHQVRDVDAKAVVADTAHWEKLRELGDTVKPFDIVFRGDSVRPDEDRRSFHEGALDLWQLQGEISDLVPMAGLPDLLSIFYTSGTTGPSKGVAYTHKQAWQTGQTVAQYLNESDVFYMTNPMCHVGLPHCLGAALFCGGTVAVRDHFSARAFWDDVRRFKATVTMMLGSVASFVWALPPSPDDRDHTLRKVLMVPVSKDVLGFCERYNVEVMSWFNMTEVSVPLHTDGFSKTSSSSCGYPRRGAIARVVDEFDQEVPHGVPGELVVRDEEPWTLSQGYVNKPQATLEAWRNLWFHTGDLFVRDEKGAFFFLDRLKDCIRRRGENISSHEVESQILAHPDVQEAAVVGVKASDGEQEVKAVVVLRDGRDLAPETLLDFLQPRLPYFCLPRFVLFQTHGLPKTQTGKVMKNVLREDSSQPGWDRQQHGYEVRR